MALSLKSFFKKHRKFSILTAVTIPIFVLYVIAAFLPSRIVLPFGWRDGVSKTSDCPVKALPEYGLYSGAPFADRVYESVECMGSASQVNYVAVALNYASYLTVFIWLAGFYSVLLYYLFGHKNRPLYYATVITLTIPLALASFMGVSIVYDWIAKRI